jgi:hypothetical protein
MSQYCLTGAQVVQDHTRSQADTIREASEQARAHAKSWSQHLRRMEKWLEFRGIKEDK